MVSQAITSTVPSDLRFRLFVERLSEALAVLDQSGKIVSWNAAAEALQGWSALEVLGEHFSCLFTKEDIRSGRPESILRDATKEGSVEESGWRRRKDGSRYWTRLTLRALRDEKGELCGFGQSSADSSGMKTLASCLEAAPDATIAVKADGTILLGNAQAARLFGYPPSELVGKPVESLLPERLRATHARRRGAYFAQPKVRPMGSGLVLNGRRRDGTEFPIEISLSPVQTEEGVLVTSVIRDLTEQNTAERALEAWNRELESFNCSVAHDLRAPLRGMNGFAQILLDDYQDKLDAGGQDCLHEICDAAHRMGVLIDDLLQLSQVGSAELKRETVNLSAVVERTLARLAAAEPSRGVEVTIASDLAASMDARLATTLFNHLLGNAWKFTRKAKAAKIDFGVAKEKQSTTYFVRDNGAGFDMAYARRLFVPLQRLHAATEFPGSGTGLATAQRIVRRHGGRIWAEGTVGRGATFYFTLPAVARGGRMPSLSHRQVNKRLAGLSGQ
jgi:PAS domain S-box-containing protein